MTSGIEQSASPDPAPDEPLLNGDIPAGGVPPTEALRAEPRPGLPPAWIRELPGDQIIIEVAGRRILAPASCPHRRGRLRFARVNGRTMKLTCPLHKATFDLHTGSRLAGPECGPLRITHLPCGPGGAS